MPPQFADGLFWLAVICCAVAQLAIFRSIAATRSAPGLRTGSAAPSRVRSAAEVLWAVVPSLALAMVLYFTWRAIHPAT